MITLVEPIEVFVYVVCYSVTRVETRMVGNRPYSRTVESRYRVKSFPTLNFVYLKDRMNAYIKMLESTVAGFHLEFSHFQRVILSEDEFVEARQILEDRKNPHYMAQDPVLVREIKGKYLPR